MALAYQSRRVAIHHGDCIDVLRDLPDACVHAIVTDPPYELGFMGKAWDGSGIAYDADLWRHCLRVLKPGGHLLSFGGTRTAHRLGVAIEDAGFEIRDAITWLYASGFPKSLDVSKAIDKALGAEREVIGTDEEWIRRVGRGHDTSDTYTDASFGSVGPKGGNITVPATDRARQWQGWGTALKPASEPIIVARKPLVGTVARNVLKHGAGGLNIDGCRVEGSSAGGSWGGRQESTIGYGGTEPSDYRTRAQERGDGLVGRWPANVVLSHAPDCAEECAKGCPILELDAQSGNRRGFATQTDRGHSSTGMFGAIGDIAPGVRQGFNDSGGASRFFATFRYQAKAPARERPYVNGVSHPTVKPLELMRWLVRLVAAPGGIVLDPFTGSGTTIEACLLERVVCVGVEREASYLPLIVQRIQRVA